jgi:hypothetical protein
MIEYQVMTTGENDKKTPAEEATDITNKMAKEGFKPVLMAHAIQVESDGSIDSIAIMFEREVIASKQKQQSIQSS